MSVGSLTLRIAAGKSLPWARWAGLVGLLLAEVLLLTLRFDTASLAEDRGLWARLIGQAHHLPHMAIAVGAALLLFAGRRLFEEVHALRARIQPSTRTWPCWALHFAALACFYRLTAMLLETDLQAARFAPVAAVAWFFLGLSVAVSLGLIALSARAWLQLARRTAVPLVVGFFVGAAAWGASLCTEQLWTVLARSTFWVVNQFLEMFFPVVICRADEFIVGTPTFLVHISPECSGCEGTGLIWVFFGVYLWLFRSTLRFPQAWLLLPLGTAAIYLANALRIAALVIVGSRFSPEVAAGGFHSQAGWLAFNGVALGLVALTRRLPFFCTAANSGTRTINPAAPYLAPLMALVASVMITSALARGFDALFPLRVLAVVAALLWFRREYARPAWSWSWATVGLGVAVFVVWLALEPFAQAATAEAGLPAQWSRGWVLTWLCFRVVGSVIAVPVAEELAFRGYLTRRLQSSDFEQVPAGRFTAVSFIGSSLLFGLLHGRWLAGMIAGMAYALAYYWRGRVADAVIAHAITNALIAVYVLTTGTWSMWG